MTKSVILATILQITCDTIVSFQDVVFFSLLVIEYFKWEKITRAKGRNCKMIDKQLKAMMDKKGLTLEKLSMLSNVPIETIRNIIYRRARNPRVDTLLALSRTLDVSMESLMGESPREEEEQLLFAYRESGEHGKKFIRAIAEIEAQWQAGVDVNEEREIPCLIPAVETSDGAAFSKL